MTTRSLSSLRRAPRGSQWRLVSLPPWYKYASKVVGVDRFGFSAPGDIVMKELGMSADNLSSEIATMNIVMKELGMTADNLASEI